MKYNPKHRACLWKKAFDSMRNKINTFSCDSLKTHVEDPRVFVYKCWGILIALANAMVMAGYY